MSASKTTATTVTLKHLAASLAEDNEISKKQAEAILGGLVGNIVKHLKKGDRLLICELFDGNAGSNAWLNLKIGTDDFRKLLTGHARTLN